MQKINYRPIPNEGVRSVNSSCFTDLIDQTVYQNEDLHHLRSYYYLHGQLGYINWTRETDIFQYYEPHILEYLKNGQAYYVFDASAEGYNPLEDPHPFVHMLYYNCEKYGIDPSRIIYASANMMDEVNVGNFIRESGKKPINVFSFPSFEMIFPPIIDACPDETSKVRLIEKYFSESVQRCFDNYTDKFFSSLSRRTRYYRMFATFMLCQSSIKEHALISHDSYMDNHYLTSELLARFKLSPSDYGLWLKSLPLTIDKDDFKINWALDLEDFKKIHDRTLFQVVNETEQDDRNGNALFYSEKTYRPMITFQPFLIYGQMGANRYLAKFGYKTYEDWFNYDFDDEPDHYVRYQKLLRSITTACEELKAMSKEDQIAWRFKNAEVLKHNYRLSMDRTYSKNKMYNFLKGLL